MVISGFSWDDGDVRAAPPPARLRRMTNRDGGVVIGDISTPPGNLGPGTVIESIGNTRAQSGVPLGSTAPHCQIADFRPATPMPMFSTPSTHDRRPGLRFKTSAPQFQNPAASRQIFDFFHSRASTPTSRNGTSVFSIPFSRPWLRRLAFKKCGADVHGRSTIPERRVFSFENTGADISQSGADVSNRIPDSSEARPCDRAVQRQDLQGRARAKDARVPGSAA
jgi:hypothetical protein